MIKNLLYWAKWEKKWLIDKRDNRAIRVFVQIKISVEIQLTKNIIHL